MNKVNTTAYLNELTKEVRNDYYLRPNILGTLYEEDIIQRLKKKEIATENVNGKAFLQVFHRECLQAVSENYNVVTGMFHATIRFNGVVYAKDLGHNVPAGQVHAHIGLTQGEAAREMLKDLTVSVGEQPAPTGPVIQAVTNPVTGLPDRLNAGAMVLIQGMRLAVRGTEEKEGEIGVYFIPSDGATDPVRIPAGQLSPNMPKKLQFMLPSGVTAGEWRVKVATQSTASIGKYTKDIREYEYPNTVTVL